MEMLLIPFAPPLLPRKGVAHAPHERDTSQTPAGRRC